MNYSINVVVHFRSLFRDNAVIGEVVPVIQEPDLPSPPDGDVPPHSLCPVRTYCRMGTEEAQDHSPVHSISPPVFEAGFFNPNLTPTPVNSDQESNDSY